MGSAALLAHTHSSRDRSAPTRRRRDKVVGVTAADVVAGAVLVGERVVGRVGGAALQDIVEIDKVGGAEKLCSVCLREAHTSVLVNGAVHAVGVVRQAQRRTNVVGDVDKGSVLDTSSAGSLTRPDGLAPYGDLRLLGSGTTEAVVGVVDGPILDGDVALTILGPVPVGEGASVVALVAESILKGKEEVSWIS